MKNNLLRMPNEQVIIILQNMIEKIEEETLIVKEINIHRLDNYETSFNFEIIDKKGVNYEK